MLGGIGLAGDPKAPRDENKGFHTVLVQCLFGIDRVVKLDLKLLAVVGLYSAFNQIFTELIDVGHSIPIRFFLFWVKRVFYHKAKHSQIRPMRSFHPPERMLGRCEPVISPVWDPHDKKNHRYAI